MRKPSVSANPTLPIQDNDHVAGSDAAAITLWPNAILNVSNTRAFPIIKRLHQA
ncbi:MAG: hypothetical protein WBO24_12425 [Nitrospirales bacterium]